jgi:host factor-I protein
MRLSAHSNAIYKRAKRAQKTGGANENCLVAGICTYDIRQGDAIMSSKNYQDAILNQVRKDNMPVTIYLTSGFQIRGVIKGFDNYVILIETDNKQQMVYKHAVSTVVPLKYLSNLGAAGNDED